jgi:hypothetical protein
VDRENRTSKLALGLAVTVVGLSVFLVVVGLPGSYSSVSESCSLGNPCVVTRHSGTYLVQAPAAGIPLVAAVVVAVGLVKNRMALSWAGLAGLLVFAFISLFSVGLLYFPFAIALVGLLSVIQGRRGAATDPNGTP